MRNFDAWILFTSCRAFTRVIKRKRMEIPCIRLCWSMECRQKGGLWIPTIKERASPCSGLLIRKHGDEKRRGGERKKEKKKEGRKEGREREGGKWERRRRDHIVFSETSFQRRWARFEAHFDAAFADWILALRPRDSSLAWIGFLAESRKHPSDATKLHMEHSASILVPICLIGKRYLTKNNYSKGKKKAKEDSSLIPLLKLNL